LRLGGILKLKAQKIQIIKRKIDISHFDGAYFKQLQYSIQKNVNSNAEIIMIDLIPNTPISDRSVLKSLLYLQREFTDILIAPKTIFPLEETEIEKLTERFNATMIMIGI
jgi:hypothetical protein